MFETQDDNLDQYLECIELYLNLSICILVLVLDLDYCYNDWLVGFVCNIAKHLVHNEHHHAKMPEISSL
jgi:hypothetical protein